MARDKGVNQDQDNPLRLLAVSQGLTHYFTGVPCFRGHVANLYAKTGKCTICAREDERKFKRTPKGKAMQRKGDDLRSIKKRGKAYNPSKHWYKHLALYEQLVAAGLPVDPTIPLQTRVCLAYNSFMELTSDDSPSSRAADKLMKRAVRMARRQYDKVIAQRQRQDREARRIEREAQRAERAPELAEKRRIRALVAQGKAMGLRVCTMRARVYNQGWTWERACSTPVSPFQHNGLAAAARAAGLRITLVESRIYTLGWSREKALTTPVGATLGLKPDSRAGMARAAGLDPNLVNGRIDKGWSLERALSTPRHAHQLTPVLFSNMESGTLKRKGHFMPRGRKPNLRRNEARDAGLRTYDDPDNLCWCGSGIRYTKNGACVECLIEKGKLRYASLEGDALDARKRKDHARYVERMAKTN